MDFISGPIFKMTFQFRLCGDFFRRFEVLVSHLACRASAPFWLFAQGVGFLGELEFRRPPIHLVWSLPRTLGPPDTRQPLSMLFTWIQDRLLLLWFGS